jgi:hypothetical protein
MFTGATATTFDRSGGGAGWGEIIFKVRAFLGVQKQLFGGLQPLNLAFDLQDELFHGYDSSL